MTKDEALKLALEALEMANELEEGYGVDFKKYGLKVDKDIRVKYEAAITAIKQALLTATPLAAPVQEPVAWTIWLHGPVDLFLHKQFAELEFERRNKQYPDKDRKLRPLVFGDTTPPAAQPATEKSSVVQTAPVQEPVGKVIASVPHLRSISVELLAEAPIPSEDSLIYTTPPAAQRQWVGLTDEDVYPLANENLYYQIEGYEVSGIYSLARAIEAKLKEKNT